MKNCGVRYCYPVLILIYRVGAHIVLPGIDPNKLDLIQCQRRSSWFFDTFAGGAFSNASIFALGIMPYISASIFMQLMTILVPQMQKIQKEGESGRKKINQWTRYLTVVLLLFRLLLMCLPARCKPRCADRYLIQLISGFQPLSS